jgi:sugar phosphate isomerase/epimerase
MEELKRWLDLFAALGIGAGVLHPGRPVEEGPLSRDELFALNVEALRTLTDHAAGGPTVICLENGPNAGRLLRLIEAVGAPNLAICLDTGHLSLGRRRLPEEGQTDYAFIVEAGARLKALHIADNDGSGDQHLLPFEGGTVDWDGVARGLRAIGYRGLFNFEIPGECRCPVEERLQKLKRAERIAERLMAQATAP